MSQPSIQSPPSIRIGIVGHRFIPNRRVEDFIRSECHQILDSVQSRSPGLTAVSAIAEGADSIFAEVALSLSIPLEIIRPFERYPDDFLTLESREIYTTLCASACQEERLAFVDRSTDAYFEAMQWVVKRSDLLIAAWDGIEGRGRGGTSDAIHHARDRHRDWVHLDVTTLRRNTYCKNFSYLSNQMENDGGKRL